MSSTLIYKKDETGIRGIIIDFFSHIFKYGLNFFHFGSNADKDIFLLYNFKIRDVFSYRKQDCHQN